MERRCAVGSGRIHVGVLLNEGSHRGSIVLHRRVGEPCIG